MGDVIGERWRRMSRVIDQFAAESKGITEYGQLQARLVDLDRLGRQIDGGANRLSTSLSGRPACGRRESET